jgi:hypothetical protein
MSSTTLGWVPTRRLVLLACVLAAVVAGGMAFHTATSSAYEGVFCSEEPRAEGAECYSVVRTNIRRAIGHVNDAFVKVAVETQYGELEGNCREYLGCEAGTGYLSHDGEGRGRIWNEGDTGTRNTNGYLYP